MVSRIAPNKSPAFQDLVDCHLASAPSAASTRWSLTAQMFHWGSAALVISLFALAMYVRFVLGFKNPAGLPLWSMLMHNHKSLGLILLLVMPARLAWALAHKRPLLPEVIDGRHQVLLKSGHRGLCASLFAVPLTGLFTAFLFRSKNSVFGLFSFASPLAKNGYLWPKFMLVHQIPAYSMPALAAAPCFCCPLASILSPRRNAHNYGAWRFA